MSTVYDFMVEEVKRLKAENAKLIRLCAAEAEETRWQFKDRIRLEKENAKLRKALEKIAKFDNFEDARRAYLLMIGIAKDLLKEAKNEPT